MPVSKSFLDTKFAELRQQFRHAGNFCFFTDADNLGSILSTGMLYSRNEAERQSIIKRDCASAQVNGRAPEWVHDCARLYFAPATPYAYSTEGPKRFQNSYPEIPRPVYLVFPPDVLTLPNVRVSNGNMGSHYTDAQLADDNWFNGLPFADIYSRGAHTQGDHEKPRRRCAEVLVPNGLHLNWLRKLIFRCQAELDLALYECGSFPAWVKAEVQPDWFDTAKKSIPHITQIASGKIQTQNVQAGDVLSAVKHYSKGVVAAAKCTYDGQKFDDWKAIDLGAAGLAIPLPGYSYYFLNGYRLGVRAAES
ncbi:DarT ssDNA thymidine ADP-ribosyltransferase family protein [Cystobacter fuscus]|uniref:DarT ssDNA thymidine ADP-ribosyltransferase family protein n=1 Tax=Cystobacter fuscus TaxID=43 RepID=UPI00097155E1|nr:DarT ssDNA thymidine ADP-ribosyltransferase family protein [Cystobacter fuscus]